MNATLAPTPTAERFPHVALLADLLAQSRAAGLDADGIRAVLRPKAYDFRVAVGELRAAIGPLNNAADDRKAAASHLSRAEFFEAINARNRLTVVGDSIDLCERLFGFDPVNAVATMGGLPSNQIFQP